MLYTGRIVLLKMKERKSYFNMLEYLKCNIKIINNCEQHMNSKKCEKLKNFLTYIKQ